MTPPTDATATGLKEAIALKPCPFCGGEAELTGFKAPEFWVHCPHMGCKATTEAFGSQYRAIAAWNTRALPSASVGGEREPGGDCVALAEGWRSDWMQTNGAHPDDATAWPTALDIARRLDDALAAPETPPTEGEGK